MFASFSEFSCLVVAKPEKPVVGTGGDPWRNKVRHRLDLQGNN